MTHPYANLMPCKDKNVNVCVGEGCYAEACVTLALREQAYEPYEIPVGITGEEVEPVDFSVEKPVERISGHDFPVRIRQLAILSMIAIGGVLVVGLSATLLYFIFFASTMLPIFGFVFLMWMMLVAIISKE